MKLTLITSLCCLFAVSSAHASYLPKGSWVGRLFSESVSEGPDSGAAPVDAKAVRGQGSIGHHVASALGPFAMFADGSSASAQTPAKRAAEAKPAAAKDDSDSDTDGESNEDEKPISPENLAKLMKHPTEPHYDLLRPLSGAWGHCEPASGEAGVQSIQDRFSSSDRTHLTRSVIKASDSACKVPVSETKTSLVCDEAGKGIVLCKAQKQETRTYPADINGAAANASKGAVPFVPVALTANQLKALDLKLGFAGLKKKKHSKKHSKKHGDDIEATEPQADGGKERHLDLRVAPAAGGETTSYRLEFLPDVAAAALEPVPAPTRSKKRPTKD